MKRVLYILVCLSLASIASALSLTNGDFENQTGDDVANVADWYDYQDDQDKYWDGPWFRGSGEETINETGCLFLGDTATSDEDGGHKAWIYQSLGVYDGIPMLEIALQWGGDSSEFGGEMGLTVMILESDGTFVPGEPFAADDIYGAGGITEIDRASSIKDVDPGVVYNELFLLDISSATVGNELFLRINNFDVDEDVEPLMSVDNITLTPLSVTNQSPEDGAEFIAVELDSPENDLVFVVADAQVSQVEVLFGMDPNLTQANKIKTFTEVTPIQYTVDLNAVTLPGDLLEDGHLKWSQNYYWQAIAYEPNGIYTSLRNEGNVWSFKAVQEGPYLGAVTPTPNGVFAGEEAEFAVFSSKVDTFQWFKAGVGGDPNVQLYDTDPNYSGTATDTLTIHDVQSVNEGSYFCVGNPSEEAVYSESGELYIKGLKHHFAFNYGEVANGKTPDSLNPTTIWAELMGGASVEQFTESEYNEPNTIIGDFLKLENHGDDADDVEYAQILDPSVFDYPEMTISAWFSMAQDADPDSKSVLWSFGEDIDNYWDFSPYTEYSGDIKARSEFRLSSDQARLDVSFEAETKRWYFTTLTYSDGIIGTVKMYIDGEYVGEGDSYEMSELPKTLAYIGKRVSDISSNYPKFDGQIDELKIYNYVMSTAEVAQTYLDVMAGVESVCNREIYDLGDYDYDDNCRVGLGDFAEMAAHWLQDYTVEVD